MSKIEIIKTRFTTQKQVRVTIKSSSELRKKFCSLERSLPLLDIGQGIGEMRHGTKDMGHGT